MGPERAPLLLLQKGFRHGVFGPFVFQDKMNGYLPAARVGFKQNNPGAVVGAVAQLDKLCGLGMRK